MITAEELLRTNEVSPFAWTWSEQVSGQWTALFHVEDTTGQRVPVTVIFQRDAYGPANSYNVRAILDTLEVGIDINSDAYYDWSEKQRTDVEMWSVDFYVSGEDDLRKLTSRVSPKDATKVLYTVGEAVVGFLKTKKPTILAWAPNSVKKTRIYARMVKLWSSRLQASAYKFVGGMLLTKSLPTTGSASTVQRYQP